MDDVLYGEPQMIVDPLARQTIYNGEAATRVEKLIPTPPAALSADPP
jgi:hypothetical protein